MRNRMKNAFQKLLPPGLALLVLLLLFTALFGVLALLMQSVPLQIAALVCMCLLFVHVIIAYVLPLRLLLDFSTTVTRKDAHLLTRLPYVRKIFEHLNSEFEKHANLQSMEQLNEIADIKLLQSQISPHFLYNTLDSVRGELYLRQIFDIADMVEALSSLFRFNIDQKKMLIPFEEELANTEKYVQIMQFRFSNRFILLKQFDEMDERIMNYPIPKLTLQPIVENAIHHGLESKIGTGIITLNIQYTDQTMMITIEDDGAGMSSESLTRLNMQLSSGGGETAGSVRHNGIALRNINERISLLYGPDYGLSVASCSGRGTQVTLMLPVNPENPYENHTEESGNE